MPESLKMTFDPMTIEHLGVRMYATLPPVIGELIANSYDADASFVNVRLKDIGAKEIVVEDDGHGMSFEEINTKFLRIGRNRRDAEHIQITPKGRKVIGKKGLGKLSFFGIAHEIAVTTRKDNKRTSFVLDWNSIKQSAGTQNGLSNYEPLIVEREVACAEPNGTTIHLRQIQRASDFNASSLANSLARIFICDTAFNIKVFRNAEDPVEVTEARRYSTLNKQIEWQIPSGIIVESDYAKKDMVVGLIFTTDKPISPSTKMRGVTLFSRKKLVNAPEYFSESASSHFFSYLTGYLEIDFIDDLDEDVIGTNRQSLNWNHPEMALLRSYLQKLIRALEVDWRSKRKTRRRDEIGTKSNIDVTHWFSKLPTEIESELSKIFDSVVDKSELDGDHQSEIITGLHKLIPEYPWYHWRHLNQEIQDASRTDYENKDYYRAFQEAAKRFITKTREKSASKNSSEFSMMGEVYGKGRTLSVTHSFKKPDGTDFNGDTLENIEDGQKHLSMGIVTGGRNPVSHEEISNLRDSGLFSEKDCLDGLSLLSHLMKRLEDAKNTSAASP